MLFFFVSDLHGHTDRYRKLLARIRQELPDVVLIGGDLLPHPFRRDLAAGADGSDFVTAFLEPELGRLATDLGSRRPKVFVILGNDDPRSYESSIERGAASGAWTYVHNRKAVADSVTVYGYNYVPPSPFQLKDWERYDVSRYVDLGCISPEEGVRSVPVSTDEARHATIARDLELLAGQDDMTRAMLLFHAPPYGTKLDRAALDGKLVDHAPLDVHVGSIAVRRFIEARQPLAALHGHIHESARLTGSWRDRIGRTQLLSAAHDGPELSLIRLDPDDLDSATRELV